MTSDLRFDGQVAVITGAGGGLGKQYALLLASRGARIVLNDIGGSVTGLGSNAEAASSVADEIRQLGGEAVADANSVTSPEGGQAIIDTAVRTWGRVDVLINNAGIVGDAPFEGRRGSTIPRCPLRMCVITSKRSATKPTSPCPADPPTRWPNSSRPSWRADLKGPPSTTSIR